MRILKEYNKISNSYKMKDQYSLHWASWIIRESIINAVDRYFAQLGTELINY